MEKNEISGQRQMEFLKKFDYIREAGTKGEEKAASLIQKELDGLGVKNHIEEFTFDTFCIRNARLTVTKPYQKEYTVTAYGRCGNTKTEGLEAPFLYVENGDEISLMSARGKVVMLNNRVDAGMYQKLLKAGAVGFISITGTPLDEGVDLKPGSCRLPGTLKSENIEEQSDRNITKRLPGVTIHYKDAEELVTRGASQVCLQTEQETVTRTSGNVIARVEGTDKKEEILTLTAHFDSVPEGPGAYDNMAGGAIIMELCRYFQKHRPRRTMEFIWFGAEEKGLLGSQNYVQVHEKELPAHQFNMNVDLAGQLVGGTVIGVTGDASICQIMTYLAHEAGIGMSTKHQVWVSDSNSFAWKGVPAMTLNRDGFGMHTRHDTIALLSDWSLKRSAELLGHIADRLGNIETMPIVRKMPPEFVQQLNEYFA